MANKPGKKVTAPRSTVSVYKREAFSVPKNATPRAKSATSSGSAKATRAKTVAATTHTTKIVPAKKVVAKKKPAKAELIKSIYHGHDFGTDTVVRETDLLRARQKAASAPPKENVPEIVTADTPVTLPPAINERLLSKQRALSKWYYEVFPRGAARLLSFVGIGFIVGGAAGLLPFISQVYPNWPAFQKALVCEFTLCGETDSADSFNLELASVVTAQTPKATVSFLTNPDAVLLATSSFIVRAEYVADVQVFVEHEDTGELTSLQISQTPTGADYTAQIDAADLTPGKYHVRVLVKAARDLTKVWFTGPVFTVGDQVVATSGSASTTAASRSAHEADMPVPASDTSTVRATADTLAPTDSASEAQHGTIRYQLRDGLLAMSVLAPTASQVWLTAESVSATKPIWLGAARRSPSNEWHFEYLLNNLPHGAYELVATTYVGTRAEETARTFFDHTQVPPSVDAATTSSILSTSEALQKLAESTDASPDRSQYLSDLRSELEFSSSTWSLLLSEEARLNTLLLRYAAVVLSNNEALLSLVEGVVKAEFDELATRAAILDEGQQAYMVRRQELADAWEHIKVKIESYEQRLAERSGRSSLADSDGDGVSDYDEYYYYNTNVFSADSDGDGVTDAVEVVRGFNPTNHKPETLTIYEAAAPADVLVSDQLALTGVLPVIETDSTRGIPAVMAEVTGRAPPHSLVTLFLENEPAVLTVRADENGSFIYPLTKMLPDGEHSLYAALLDNGGYTVAKSEPFTFTKIHEFFVPRQEDAVATVVSATVWSPTTSDLANIIIALCVMILGLGSLLIGYRLLRSSDNEEKTTSSLSPATESQQAAELG